MTVAGAPSIPFLELLACPFCAGTLEEERDRLVCTVCARTFPVSDGAPVLLPGPTPAERARGLVGRAVAAVVAVPAVYDLVQRLAGLEETHRRLRRMLEDGDGALVLDVGAGTGMLETILPPTARYLWLDSDLQKLAGFRARSASPAIVGNATTLPLADASVDWAISSGVAHHLDDAELERMLDELRRVTLTGVVFVDAVVSGAPASRLLWRYDRGRHPRTSDTLWQAVERRFDIVAAEEFRLLHRYLLVRAV